ADGAGPHPISHRGGGDHPGLAELDEARTFRVLHHLDRQADGPQLVISPAVGPGRGGAGGGLLAPRNRGLLGGIGGMVHRRLTSSPPAAAGPREPSWATSSRKRSPRSSKLAN